MGIRVDILAEVKEALEFINRFQDRDVINSLRYSINKTLVSLRKESIEEIRKRLNLKSTVLRQQYLKMERAKGSTITSIEGTMWYSGRAIPMLEFVAGNKDVIEQKGIKVKSRRKLRVRVVPGKSLRLDKAFIQRVHTKQVFKRSGKKGEFKKQGVVSVATLLRDRGLGDKLASFAKARFGDVFLRDLAARTDNRFTKG